MSPTKFVVLYYENPIMAQLQYVYLRVSYYDDKVVDLPISVIEHKSFLAVALTLLEDVHFGYTNRSNLKFLDS
jgi:hypothetical protein